MDPIEATITKVRKTILRYGMIDRGDCIIVAVSGGADSVCLLDILHKLRNEMGLKLVVAHYDHGLRGSEDARETRFVECLSASLHLPFETKEGFLAAEGPVGSLEERARDARYAFLEDVRKRFHAQKIALGHNLNDQAETVLMRLLRGSGPSGMGGIPPVRDNTFIRPLIATKRQEIESYLRARALAFITDSSNLETTYLRNKIRIELLPLLTKYQPRLVEHLGQLAGLLRGENSYMDEEAGSWVKRKIEKGTEGALIIPLIAFMELPPALRSRVVRHLLRRIGGNLRRIEHRHIQSVFRLARSEYPQGAIDLPKGLHVKKTYDRLSFSRGKDREPPEFYRIIDGPGTYHFKEIDRSLSIVELEPGAERVSDHPETTAYLDFDRMGYPLVVRNFRPGDRFIPLGMTGHKKIKDFFIDLKVPSDMRASIPLLLSQDTMVWVCGYRIDDRFKVSSETGRILKATISG